MCPAVECSYCACWNLLVCDFVAVYVFSVDTKCIPATVRHPRGLSTVSSVRASEVTPYKRRSDVKISFQSLGSPVSHTGSSSGVLLQLFGYLVASCQPGILQLWEAAWEHFVIPVLYTADAICSYKCLVVSSLSSHFGPLHQRWDKWRLIDIRALAF